MRTRGGQGCPAGTYSLPTLPSDRTLPRYYSLPPLPHLLSRCTLLPLSSDRTSSSPLLSQVMSAKKRYEIGLEKLQFTEQQVGCEGQEGGAGGRGRRGEGGAGGGREGQEGGGKGTSVGGGENCISRSSRWAVGTPITLHAGGWSSSRPPSPQVVIMQEELTALKPNLIRTVAETERLMATVQKEKTEVGRRRRGGGEEGG